MSNHTVLRIRKRTTSGWLLMLIIMLPFLFGTLNDLLQLPWAIRYLMDAAWIVLLGMMIQLRAYTGNWKVGVIGLWVLLFLIYTALMYVLQYQSALYYLWGIRNNFRFYTVFFAASALLTVQDTEDYLKLFDGLFWLNILISLVQFLLLDLQGDQLGGLFGTASGVNGYTNIFFIIVISKSVVFYLEKRESAASCMSKCAAALLIAALSELKFFFMEFILIIVLAALFTNFTWRKVWIILAGFTAAILGAALLTKLFPYFTDWFSIRWFLDRATSIKGYTHAEDLNRLNAIPQINELWLKNAGQRLFGYGLGNCDTSTFSFLNTPFYQENNSRHYSWLSYAFMYLECGYIGLVFFWGFFVLVYFRIRRIERASEGIARSWCRIARIMALLCVLISFYNGSLRTEAGYMAYFVLAVPFACSRQFLRRKRV